MTIRIPRVAWIDFRRFPGQLLQALAGGMASPQPQLPGGGGAPPAEDQAPPQQGGMVQ